MFFSYTVPYLIKIGGIFYENMSVTDPIFYNIALHNEYTKAILVISLPDAPLYHHNCHEKRYYKFIAKIFPKDVPLIDSY